MIHPELATVSAPRYPPHVDPQFDLASGVRPLPVGGGRGTGFTAFVLIVCGLLLSPTLVYRMGLDQGTYGYMAAELLQGRWPYIFTWDHQFPGGIVIQAIEILLFGRSIAMFRLFDLLYQLANVYLIYRITSAVAGRAGGYFAAVTYVLIYQGYGPWNTGQRESFALFFVLLAFWLYLTAGRRSPIRTAAWIGLALGIAITIKPTFLAFGLMYAPLAGRMTRSSRRLIGVAGLALIGPSVAFILFYWVAGGLRALYEACIAYQTQVYIHRLRGDAPLWMYWWSKLWRLGGHAIAIAAAYLPFLIWGPMRRERAMLYVGYLASLVTVFAQGTFAGYHYLPGLGIGSILVGSIFTQVVAAVLPQLRFRLRSRAFAAPMLLAHGAVLIAAMLYVDFDRVRDLVGLRFLDRPRPNELRNGTVFDFTEDYELAEYLNARTSRGDRIQIWGHEALVYYLADRSAASRFQSSNPLVMRVPHHDITPMQRRWRQEFMSDLALHAPPYLAVVRQDNWWWAPDERTSDQLLEDFPELKGLIRLHYSAERTVGRFVVYRRVNASGPT